MSQGGSDHRTWSNYIFQVSSLIGELASAAAVEKGIVFDEGMEDRLCAYSRAVSHFPTAAKEVKSCHQLKIANSYSRYVCVHVTEFWFVSCSNAPSSNGEMVGSIHSPKRQLQKENQIHAHYIQNGSKNWKLSREIKVRPIFPFQFKTQCQTDADCSHIQMAGILNWHVEILQMPWI